MSLEQKLQIQKDIILYLAEKKFENNQQVAAHEYVKLYADDFGKVWDKFPNLRTEMKNYFIIHYIL